MVKIQQKEPMAMYPMASRCKGMAEKPISVSLLMIPGVVLILIGILILFESKILVWLVATIIILFGGLLLVFTNFIHKFGRQFRNVHGQ